MSYEETIHTYRPDATGRCWSGWYNERGVWVRCGSTQRASVLHDDPEAEFRQRHHHDGGDCMCFEDPAGPTFQEAMREYVQSR